MEEFEKQLSENTSTEADFGEITLYEDENLDSSMDFEQEESLSDSVKIISPTRLVLKRFFRSKLSIVGLVMLIALFLFSFIGPLFSPWSETDRDKSGGKGSYLELAVTTEITVIDENGNEITQEVTFYDVTYDVLTENIYAPPSKTHWLGTDEQGMDIFTRLMYGGRISLTIGFVVVFLSTAIGVLLGGLAGYFGKWVDQLIMRLVDIFYCVPQTPMLLIASSLLGAWNVPGQLRIYFLMLILVFFGWAGTARMVRGQILSLREQEFMLAAKATGMPTSKKIFKHLVPNVMPQLIVSMTLSLGGIILTEATLSFLQLGVPAPYAAWGSMISATQNVPGVLENYFNMWAPPGVCIVLAVLAFNFVGDGLRDAFDPKARR